MPHYYFNCRVGDLLAEDRDGYDLPGLDAAREETSILMAELARDQLPVQGEMPDLSVSVSDDDQIVLFRLVLLHGAGDD